MPSNFDLLRAGKGLRSALAGAMLLTLATFGARAIDWPANYDVAEKTTSPDGRYAILAPTVKATPASAPAIFYLVDLKAHRVLGEIPRTDNRTLRTLSGVRANWQPDSGHCLVQIDDRYGGYAAVTVLTRKDDAFEQYDIGDKMRTDAGDNLRRLKAFYEANYAAEYLPDGKILFHTWVFAKVGAARDIGTFIGTFDPATGGWQKITTQTTVFYSADKFREAHLPLGPDYAALSEEKKAAEMESAIYEIGLALRAFLAAEPEAAFEKEQTAWFPKRDALPAGPERRKLIEDRVQELKTRLWNAP